MSDYIPPEYRIRLFLSVDLIGSTEFKSNNHIRRIDWIKAFQKFYGEFPRLLELNYKAACEGFTNITDCEIESKPKIWKTIGDEILFVNRLNSVNHLSALISAFSTTLVEFGRQVNASDSLNTKGNAWIGAFPSPNRSISLSTGSDPLLGDEELPTEKFESDVDKNPSKYDFLGKGIDAGFRIARNSSVDALTLSPALAYLLCKALGNPDSVGFKGTLVFHEPQEFKGVVKGQRYPVISLLTSRDEHHKRLQELEAKLLHRPRDTSATLLQDYLESYMFFHSIETPVLKITGRDKPVKPPEHYNSYIEECREEWVSITALKAREQISANEGNEYSITVETAEGDIAIKEITQRLEETSKFMREMLSEYDNRQHNG